MRAAAYEYDIEIHGYSFTTNDYGEQEPSYTLKYSMYAAKSQTDGKEDIEGNEGEGNLKVYTRREVWTIRDAGQSISTKDKLKHNDEWYDIINVESINNRVIEITTEYRQ